MRRETEGQSEPRVGVKSPTAFPQETPVFPLGLSTAWGLTHALPFCYEITVTRGSCRL